MTETTQTQAAPNNEPEKLDMHMPGLVEDNLAWVAARFPGCITESRNDQGEVVRAVDFDLLRQELSTEIVEGPRERYHLNWPGKRESLLAANAPIAKTLRPCREESVDFDTTRNLFIEGDNLDALKLLQETYLNKIKMIYVDPPYNTGNDFVYSDDFAVTASEYFQESMQASDEGNRLVTNPESAGRFHSSWLSMMYSRLRLARTLLASDGVIFISIDDREIHNLRKLCDEIFGEHQFIATFKWNKTSKAPSLSDSVRNKYEYIVAYTRDNAGRLKGRESYNEMAPLFNSGNPMRTIVFPPGSIDCMFADGVYKAGDYTKGSKTVTLENDLVVKDRKNAGEIAICASFSWTQETVRSRMTRGTRFAFKTPTFLTMYYTMDPDAGDGTKKFIAPSDLINKEECGVGRNDEGLKDLQQLFGGHSPFDYRKPVSLIEHLCSMIPDKDYIALDFFAGSATTAHAVLKKNVEDGGTRRFIMIQLDEDCPDDSAAAKMGYKTVSEIGIERIRRATAQIRTDAGLSASEHDFGFRTLRVDSSNMKDVYYRPDESSAELLGGLVDNIKDDRGDEDLLIQVLLDWGVDLSLPITTETIGGKAVYFVDTNALAACFEAGITEGFVKELAGRKPLRVVFRDSGYIGDDVKINVEQIFKQLSPGTDVKTL